MLESLIPNRSSLRGSSTAGRSNQRSQRGARRRGARLVPTAGAPCARQYEPSAGSVRRED